MSANPWELRADVTPLEVAATRWAEVGALMARRGDEIVDAARRATEGWDASAAESYEDHRRQVLVNLDRFTTLVTQVSGSLRAISAIVTSTQKELDQAWTTVATIPHDVVGESRHLVFSPAVEEDRGAVARGQQEAEQIRSRLALSLDQESVRLRAARAELVTVRTEIAALTGSGLPRALAPGEEESGVGTVPPVSTPESTAAPGSAEVAAGALPPLVAPVTVSMPELAGISSAALAPIAATAAGGVLARAGGTTRSAAGVPPIGAMGAGAMGARAGAMSRTMAGGRGGPARLATPKLEGPGGDVSSRASRAAGDTEAAREAEKEAKRAALEEKRAERAARKAEREAERERRADPRGVGPDPDKAGGTGTRDRTARASEERRDDEGADDDLTPVEGVEEQVGGADADETEDAGSRPAVIAVVHYAPGEEPEEPRR